MSLHPISIAEVRACRYIENSVIVCHRLCKNQGILVLETWLATKMNSPYGMAVAEVKGGDDLSEEPAGLLGCEPALLHQVVEQLPAGYVFQHQVPNQQVVTSSPSLCT